VSIAVAGLFRYRCESGESRSGKQHGANYLAAMRRDLRCAVLEKLREITSGEQEFRREARTLLGIDL